MLLGGLGLALAWLLPPLLRGATSGAETDRTQLNLTLLRDQLAELESDRARGAFAGLTLVHRRGHLARRGNRCRLRLHARQDACWRIGTVAAHAKTIGFTRFLMLAFSWE